MDTGTVIIEASPKEKVISDLLQGEVKKESKEKNRPPKIKNKVYCPYCNQETVLIWVHSHYQCGRCKYIVTGCCE